MSNKEIVLNHDAFLVSETDEKGIIRFANSSFCDVVGYEVDELIGKPHNIIRHPDMPKVAFKQLWDTIQKGETWTGFVKNLAKNGDYYWVYATIYPIESCDGSKGYLSCRRKPSQEEIDRHEALYKELKAKE
jgi:aerotaxis receptor